MRSALSVAAIAACASVAVARPQDGHVRCAALPSDSVVEKASKMAIDEANGLFNNFHMADETIEIDTYFHVVASNDAESTNTTVSSILIATDRDRANKYNRTKC